MNDKFIYLLELMSSRLRLSQLWRKWMHQLRSEAVETIRHRVRCNIYLSLSLYRSGIIYQPLFNLRNWYKLIKKSCSKLQECKLKWKWVLTPNLLTSFSFSCFTWFADVSAPRSSLGAISAVKTGTTYEKIPIPYPVASLPISKDKAPFCL